MKHSLLLPALTLLALNVAGTAQDNSPYVLDWSHTDVAAAPERRSVPPASTRARPFYLDLSARFITDHVRDRYVKVRKVEVTVYRAGRYPATYTFRNLGRYYQFDVRVPELLPGDRYEIVVVWSNRSRRRLDGVIGKTPPRSLYVDEPDAFDTRP